MATSTGCLVLLCLVSPLLLPSAAVLGHPWGGGLFPQFYDHSCPKAKEIVQSIVSQAVAKETRMAASLVRLHFHDCFVKEEKKRQKVIIKTKECTRTCDSCVMNPEHSFASDDGHVLGFAIASCPPPPFTRLQMLDQIFKRPITPDVLPMTAS